MTEWTCALPKCDQPAHEQRICLEHTSQLLRHLAELPARLRDLDITVSRQARMVPRSRERRSNRQPLPYNARASEVEDRVRKILRELASAVDPTQPWSRTSLHTVAWWIHSHAADLLKWGAIERATLDLARVTALIDRVTDRPPLVLYAGRCGHRGCDIALYAEPGETFVVCPMCRTRHDVAKRRDRMRDQIHDMLLTLPEIVGFASYFEHFDRRRAQKLLVAWRARGRIKGQTIKGQEVYPFGATLNLLLGAERRPPRTQRLDKV
jgi:hypothetical protein